MTIKFLNIGSQYYINLDEVLYIKTYNKNTINLGIDKEIPDKYEFAIRVEWAKPKNYSTTYFLTAEEWQYTYSQLQLMRLVNYDTINTV